MCGRVCGVCNVCFQGVKGRYFALLMFHISVKQCLELIFLGLQYFIRFYHEVILLPVHLNPDYLPYYFQITQNKFLMIYLYSCSHIEPHTLINGIDQPGFCYRVPQTDLTRQSPTN